MMANSSTHYEQMYAALKRIMAYQPPDRLRRRSWTDWGVGPDEALAMAYENLQHEAKRGLRGVRKPKSPTAAVTRTNRADT